MSVKHENGDEDTKGAASVPTEKNGSVETDVIKENKSQYQTCTSAVSLKPSFIKEVIQDRVIRFKCVLSVIVTAAIMTSGYNINQIGPAFPDLLEITNTDLEKGSVFMTSNVFGRLAGCVLGGILHSKMNTNLMFVVFFMLSGAAGSAVPWCSGYELMVTVQVIHGITGGVLNVAIISTSMQIWGATTRGRTFIQLLFVFQAAGSALVPIGTAPFLSETELVADDTSNITKINGTSTGLRNAGNLSENNLTLSPSSPSGSPESTLYIAYTISAGFSILASIPFMFFYVTNVNNSRGDRKPKTTAEFLGNLPRTVNWLQLINIGIYAAVHSVARYSYPIYLTVFCIEYFEWEKSAGAMMISVFFFATMSGRIASIFFVRVMKSHTVLLSSTIFLTLGFVCLTTSSYLYADIGVWISTLIIGLVLGVIWPTTLSWTNSYLIPVDGKVSSYLLVLGYIGPLLCPSLLGYLMEEVSFLWFCYVSLIAASVNIINAIFMVWHTVAFHKIQMYTMSKNHTLSETPRGKEHPEKIIAHM